MITAAACIFALLVMAGILYMCVSAIDGRYEPMLLFWAVCYPVGSYYLAFPRDRAVITFDRVVILGLAIATLLFVPRTPKYLSAKLNKISFWGVLFVAAVAFSILMTPQDFRLSAARVAIDAFVLPLLLAWITYRSFRVHRYVRELHAVVCVVSIYLAAIALMEVISGQYLMPRKDTLLWYAGTGSIQILRPSGPFSATGILSLVGMINLFLIVFLRRVMGRLPLLPRLLHWTGVTAAFFVSVITLTRAVFVAYIVILAVDMLRRRRMKAIWKRVAFVTALCGLVVGFVTLMPEVAKERTDGSNLWARVAQTLVSLRMFSDHPLTGVGFCYYHNAAEENPSYSALVFGTQSVGDPHNFLGAVLAETGLIGILPLIVSQVWLVKVFNENKLKSSEGRLVWDCFLMTFLAYWIMNMDVTVGYYGQLNVWSAFVLAILLKFPTEHREFKDVHLNLPPYAEAEVTMSGSQR